MNSPRRTWPSRPCSPSSSASGRVPSPLEVGVLVDEDRDGLVRGRVFRLLFVLLVFVLAGVPAPELPLLSHLLWSLEGRAARMSWMEAAEESPVAKICSGGTGGSLEGVARRPPVLLFMSLGEDTVLEAMMSLISLSEVGRDFLSRRSFRTK